MSADDEEPIVLVRDAYKRYSAKSVILSGLNMTIERGTIYGLLGPSGCGKSTLLNCIVGRLVLDSGSVKVAVNGKTRIGYMPQDIALNGDLTIDELIAFYGRIYLLSWERIAERSVELSKLLELPPKDRLIRNCSGGQQRRISMAITLIHDPELLIMDEPTVGIDPLLCASIWGCFFELVQKRFKTIIITTHYIEEAKSANRIGLMRSGVLLAENSPQLLMEKFECQSLEEVFLNLSQKQEEHIATKPYPPIQKQHPLFEDRTTFNRTRFMAQLKKNWSWTLRNLGVTLFVMLMPTICLVIVCSSDLAEMVTTPIAVVVPPDHVCPSNSTPIRDCLEIADFTCRYIEILESKYPLRRFTDEDLAWKEAKKGRLAAVLSFHNNFTQGLMERVEKQSATSSKALDEGTMYTIFDMGSYPVAHRMMARVYISLEDLLHEICDQCHVDKRLARIPVSPATTVHGSFDWAFQDSFLPPTVLPFVFYTMFIYSSSALTMETSSGLLERYRASGLTVVEILGAQAFLQLTIMNIQNVLMVGVVYGIYRMVMLGSFGTVFLILFLSELLGMAIGILVALLVRKETAVSMMGVCLQFVVFMSCGCMWPVEGQHWIVRTSGKFFPLTPLSQSYFNIALRGRSIADMTVTLSIVYCACSCVVLALITSLLIRLKFIKI